jgi:hypothetical protein
MMKTTTLLALCVLSAFAPAARASWFEFCDLEGRVESIGAPKDEATTLTVTIVAARRARELGEESYTDCTEHLGTRMDVEIELPAEAGTPANGDVLVFSRSSIDGFDHQGGFLGNQVEFEFIELRKSAPDAKERP